MNLLKYCAEILILIFVFIIVFLVSDKTFYLAENWPFVTKTKMSTLNMEYNFLGRSGLKVSNICLGAMNFGSAAGHYDVRMPFENADD